MNELVDFIWNRQQVCSALDVTNTDKQQLIKFTEYHWIYTPFLLPEKKVQKNTTRHTKIDARKTTDAPGPTPTRKKALDTDPVPRRYIIYKINFYTVNIHQGM